MKKIIITLCISLILIIALTSCGRNKNNDTSKDTTDTKKNEQTTTNPATDTKVNDGMITDTGSDTNIIDNAESMINSAESRMSSAK